MELPQKGGSRLTLFSSIGKTEIRLVKKKKVQIGLDKLLDPQGNCCAYSRKVHRAQTNKHIVMNRQDANIVHSVNIEHTSRKQKCRLYKIRQKTTIIIIIIIFKNQWMLYVQLIKLYNNHT